MTVGSELAAAATAGPGPPVGGPGVKKPTGSLPRVLSRDPEAFGKPTGREEEWRVTPLRRLRGLLDGVPEDGILEVEVTERGAKVERIGMDDPRVGTALAPADRVTALAMANAVEA